MASPPLFLTVDVSLRERSWRSSVFSLFTSTLVQGGGIGALIVIPLLVTTTLPAPVSRLDLPRFVPVALASPPSAQEATSVRVSPGYRPRPITGELVAPALVPDVILDVASFGQFEQGVETGVPGGVDWPEAPSVDFEPVPVEEDPEPVRIGEVRPPRKIVHVDPIYPRIALQAGIEGSVVLQAIIDREGNVIDLAVQKSVPSLDKAAIAAVSQWKYQPTILNGRPVPVIMSVTIDFGLTRGK